MNNTIGLPRDVWGIILDKIPIEDVCKTSLCNNEFNICLSERINGLKEVKLIKLTNIVLNNCHFIIGKEELNHIRVKNGCLKETKNKSLLKNFSEILLPYIGMKNSANKVKFVINETMADALKIANYAREKNGKIFSSIEGFVSFIETVDFAASKFPDLIDEKIRAEISTLRVIINEDYNQTLEKKPLLFFTAVMGPLT